MRVIIVGGGIAGLSLAGALESAGIDFVLLEARAVFDPQVGASIGLGPASMRILDQLGAAQEIMDATVPVELSRMRRGDGSLLAPPSTAFQLVKARFGYGVNFLDRQIVLRAIAKSIKSRDKMLVNKFVRTVEHFDTGVTVHCEDGSSYHGDLVVGCDGVNSKASIRSEMYRLAAKVDPSYFPESEATRMKAEYICLYGISNPTGGLVDGDVDQVFDIGRCFLVMTGKDGRVFWFYIEKLDRAYHYHAKDYPRYSKLEAEKLVLENAWRPCAENITLGDLWKNRVSFALVPLEEALFEQWSWGRIATVGDNAHKMTPNSGEGGNNAVQSAASLVNHLKVLADSGEVITLNKITAALRAWRKKRHVRITATWKEAARNCRLQALDSVFAKYITNWVLPLLLPYGTEFIVQSVTNKLIGAEILEFLPIPDRSLHGTCAFNPKQGTGQHESRLLRAAMAAPLLLIPLYQTMGPAVPRGFESMRYLTEASLIYSLWLIESQRRANKTGITRAAVLFGVLSGIFGPNIIAPFYFFLHYIFSPVERFAADDMRLTDLAFTRTILPLMLLLLGGAAYAKFTVEPSFVTLNILSQAWYTAVAPLFLWTVQWVLVKIGLSKSTLFEDSMRNCRRDLPQIKTCIYTLGSAVAATWLFEVMPQLDTVLQAKGFNQIICPAEHTAVYLSGLLWIVLFANDLKSAGMTQASWWKILLVALVLVVLGGPILVVAGGWLWREDILASRKEQHAITREKYQGKTFLEVQNTLI